MEARSYETSLIIKSFITLLSEITPNTQWFYIFHELNIMEEKRIQEIYQRKMQTLYDSKNRLQEYLSYIGITIFKMKIQMFKGYYNSEKVTFKISKEFIFLPYNQPLAAENGWEARGSELSSNGNCSCSSLSVDASRKIYQINNYSENMTCQ